jgi:hypothetical protein
MDTHPHVSRKRHDYLSYLLRLWKASDGEVPVWRASLRSSRTGEKVGFASLEDLFEFLRQQTGVVHSADSGHDAGDLGSGERGSS